MHDARRCRCAFLVLLCGVTVAPEAAAQSLPTMSTPESLASERHFARLRDRLPPMRAAAIDRLRTSAPALGYTVLPDGSITGLSARSLVPRSCGPLDMARPELVAERIRCFMRSAPELFVDGAGQLNFEFVEFAGARAGAFTGELIVDFQQRHQGLAVEPGSLQATLYRGNVIALSGRVFNPTGFPDVPANPPAVALSTGQRELRRYLSAEHNVVVREVDDPARDRVVLVDEQNGRELVERPNAVRGVPITSDANGFNYPVDSNNQWCHITADCQGSAECESGYFCNNNGQCEYVASQTLGTPDPATYMSTQLQSLCLDATGNDHELYCGVTAAHQCAYTLGRDNQPTYPVMRLDPNVPLVPRPFEWLTNCEAEPFAPVTPYSGHPAYDGTLLWPSVVAYQNLTMLADMFWHWSSFFPAPSSPPQLTAIANANSTFYLWGTAELVLTTANAMRMAPTAHEYGHYIHHALGGGGTLDVKEGWANTVPLRWSVYEVVGRGLWPVPPAGYDMEFAFGGVTPYKHDEKIVNGEWVIDTLFGNEDFNYHPHPFCGTNPDNGYACGSMIGMLYWELAWDFCRLAYGSCGSGERVIQSGPYYAWAWALANSAFAWAIDNTTADTTEFLEKVDMRYKQFWQTYGFMSQADYERVQSVLAHHCTGAAAACADNKLPGSPLPSEFTHKVGFSEGEAPSSFTPFGVLFHNDSSASGDAFVDIYYSGSARYDIWIDDPYDYDLNAVTKPSPYGGDNILVRVDSNPTVLVTLPTSGSWQWKSLLTGVSLAAGWHTVTLQATSSRTAYIDAIAFDPTPSNFGKVLCEDL